MAIDHANEWAESYVDVIKKLVDEIKVNIIVDDLYDPIVPWFQDGIIAQAVDWAVEGKDGNKGVAYFSAAGNDTNISYQSTFRGTPYSEISSQLPTTSPGNTEQYLYHDFDADEENIDILQKVQFPQDYSQSTDDPNVFIAQWAQPWDNNNSANEIWFFTEDNGELKFVDKTTNEPSHPVAAYPLLPEKLFDYDPVGKTFYVAFVHNTHGYDCLLYTSDAADE